MDQKSLHERHKAVMPSWIALYYDEPIALERGEGRRDPVERIGDQVVELRLGEVHGVSLERRSSAGPRLAAPWATPMLGPSLPGPVRCRQAPIV